MNLYDEITGRIIEQLEQGIIPWQMPWIGSSNAISHVTGKPYSLLNQMLLGRPGEYITFRQCQHEGGRVRRGEKSSMVVFWKWVEQEDKESGEIKYIPFLRSYNVFHIDQCEGLNPRYNIRLCTPVTADATADSIISAYLERSAVRLHYTGDNHACYRPSDDSIHLPLREQFRSTAEYYSTFFHEILHSTGHATRLDRLDHIAAFGSEDYSKEELIAEIGAAALVNQAGLETASSFRNSAAYIQNWLSVLRNDKRFIVSAAGKAEKAVNLILNNTK